MTDEQVNRTVEHLREQLHLAIRLKGTEAFPAKCQGSRVRWGCGQNRIAYRLKIGGRHNPAAGTGD
jgi:hypothetical protein